MKIQTLTVYSQALAGYLMWRGQKLLAMGPNTKKPGLNLFIFKDTEELRALMQEFKPFDTHSSDRTDTETT